MHQRPHAVVTRNISKDFPSGDEDVRVLFDVNITIPTGELTMLVGPSGCGKTTLLSIITGILSPTEGEVHVLGQNVTAMRGARKVEFRRKHMGFIFQQYNLLPALTAAENAAVALVADGMPLAEATARTRDILEDIGMKGHTHKLPSQLSGGQQQRAAIARALSHQPELIVCDEPTAALDAHTGQKVLELLRAAAQQQNRAVIVVTHDNRIFHFADRIFHMEDGRIINEEIVKGAHSA